MITPLQKRSTWKELSQMSPAELATANGNLLTRLKPFMHNPLANTPISAFFYNEQASRQLTVYTNDKGIFSFHAALDFVPTHVRVLAGENLSATEEIRVTSPKGVSLISDIDDTVKHSAIGGKYQDIFRNVFIRDLSDLTIEGVREWYNTLYDMGVKMHYVSNSPWQLYPVLTTFFKLAHLPKGSFHLKQYAGMLDGIFEPVAERKKASLSKIMRDFPDRKFMLVGDSGEADLEVYTDVALDHPGRVLGIFIRDVTTTVKTGYFDPSVGSGGGSGKHSRNHSRHQSGDSLAMSKRLSRPVDIKEDDQDLQAAIVTSLADMEEEARRARRSINPDAPALASFDGGKELKLKPELPAPRRGGRVAPEAHMTTSPDEDLIDFSDEPAPRKPWLASSPRRLSTPKGASIEGTMGARRPSPSRPPKPQALRSPSYSDKMPTPTQDTPKFTQDTPYKSPPPRPRKPSTTIRPMPPESPQQMVGSQPPASQPHPGLPQLQTHHPSPLSQVSRQDSPIVKARPPLPTRPKTVQKLASAAAPLAAVGQPRPPSSYGSYTAETPRAMSMASKQSIDSLRGPESSTRTTAPPPPPARRNVPAYPFSSTTRKTTNRNSGTWDSDSPLGSPGDGMSTKERLWRQRWAKTQGLLEPRGVTLRTWRVGSDVADVAVKLAEMELREIERERREEGRRR